MQIKKIKQTKTAFMAFKATPDFKQRIDSVAKIEGKKTSVLIREAIEAKLAYSERLSGKEKMPE